MPQSTPSCLYVATTLRCFKVGGRQHASTRRIVTFIFRLQHRRERQINALKTQDSRLRGTPQDSASRRYSCPMFESPGRTAARGVAEKKGQLNRHEKGRC